MTGCRWTKRGVPHVAAGWLAGVLLLALAYYLTGRLGLILAIPPGFATAVWPPAGMAMAVVLLGGYRLWPGVWLGSFVLNLEISLSNPAPASLTTAVFIGIGASLQACTGAWLVRTLGRFPNPLSTLREISSFLFLGGPLSCVLGATLGAATLFVDGAIGGPEIPFTWWTWWVGDTIGVLLIAPLAAIVSWRSYWPPRRVLMVGLPMCLAFGLAVGVFVSTSEMELRRQRLDFERNATALAIPIQRSFEGRLHELESIATVVQTFPDLDAAEFREVAATALAHGPGTQGYSWNVVVLNPEREAFEKRVQQAEVADFHITQMDQAGEIAVAESRDQYVTVRYIEPLAANARVLGLDVYAQLVRRETMDRARDTGQPVATSFLVLAQRSTRRDGFLVFHPVYAQGPRTTIAERRKLLRGFVVAVLLAGDVATATQNNGNVNGLQLQIEDCLDKSRSAPVFSFAWDTAHAAALPKLAHTNDFVPFDYQLPLDVAGQKWQLRLRPTREYLAGQRTWHTWAVLAGGLLMTSFVGAFLLFVTGQQAHTEEVVRERTKKLAQANRQLNTVLNASTQTSIIATDLHGTITVFNAGAERMLGYSSQEMIGIKTPEIIHLAEEVSARSEHLTQTLGYDVKGFDVFVEMARLGRYEEREWTYITKQGRHLKVILSVTAQLDECGEIAGFLGVAVDITERRRTEEKFRCVVESSPNAMVMANQQGKIVLVNAQTERVFGYSRQELIDQPLEILLPARYQGSHPAAVSNFFNEPKVRQMGGGEELFGRRKDATEIPVEIGLNPIETDEGLMVLSSIIDISERKRAEIALRDSGERLRLTLKNAGHAMWEWDITSGSLVFDQNWCSILGYHTCELQSTLANWTASMHPDDKERVLAALEQHLVSPESLCDVDYRGLHKTGEWVWLNTRGQVCKRDGDGRPWRMMGTIHEITERKKAEEKLALRAAELARSNAELEQFAYVASHDLREPLRMVQSFCGLLKDRYSGQLDDRADKYIHFAVDGAARMQRLVDDLLEFSRVGRSNEHFRSVELADVVAQAMNNLDSAISDSGATIKLGSLPAVHGDSQRLIQVFQNLIGNAIKFRGSAPPTIEVTSHEDVDAWRITVTDRGIGIDPQHFSRLFVLFQRLHTKDEYPGTGIGLALCKRIIELHGGEIWLESEPGRGTSFHFRLLASNPLISNHEDEEKEAVCMLSLTQI